MFDDESLDSELRAMMMAEFELDVENDRLYYSTRFTERGRSDYPALMRTAIESGNDETLRDLLNQNDRLALEELRNGKTVKVPKTAAATFAEGEFSRYYARAICRRALSHEVNEVEVYRAKAVTKPRKESEALIGTRAPATTLLDDLRTNLGVDTALGLPAGPNSGLTVRCACERCSPE